MYCFGVCTLMSLLTLVHLTQCVPQRSKRSSNGATNKYHGSIVRDFPAMDLDTRRTPPIPMNVAMLDRNMAIACTNRHNCEVTCARAKNAKFTNKNALMDAFTSREGALTDAHKLGIQFGHKKSCDKCALIYSNCGNQVYGIAKEQLFTWRMMTPTDGTNGDDQMISFGKSNNNL